MSGEVNNTARFSFANWDWTSELAPLGACAYIAGASLPFRWDIPLIVLALSGGLVTFFTRRNPRPADRSPLLFPVVVFFIVTGLSVLLSEDQGRSLRLSTPLVPAVLLFFLIANHFQGPRHARLLYLTFSAVGLGLAVVVILNAWKKGWVVPPGWQSWVGEVRSPLLVVPNDTAFLAVIAPLSLALLCSDPRYGVKIFSALSILLSIAAVCVIQSRVAILTMIGSLTFAAAFVRPRLALLLGTVVFAAALLADGFLGFPLAHRFLHIWDGGAGQQPWDPRLQIWAAAWADFLKAPFFGHGLHTFDYTSAAAINLRWAHNLYLETLAEQGVIGLAALGFLLFCGLSAARSIQRAEISETRALGAGALAALLGFCFAALLELSFLRQWVAIIFFALLGVVAQLAAYKERPDEK